MPRRILIVDDDPLLREIAVELLSGAGYACDTAEDGRIGLDRLAAAPADLVLLDMIMPNMDGIEALGAIKRGWPGTPVLVMSAGTRAMSMQSLLRIARNLGADEIIQKPLTAARLLPIVAQLLGEQSQVA